MKLKGMLYGIGVGPGDPELITVKAIKILEQCDIAAAPSVKGHEQTALKIAAPYIKGKQILNLDIPMTHNSEERYKSHIAAVDEIAKQLDNGRNVALLTLGDPTVYSSYWYIHRMLVNKGYEAEIIPGVTSFCAAAARLGEALCEDGQMLHIIPASHGFIKDGLDLPGNKIFMKAGRKLPMLMDELRNRGQLSRASLVEQCGMENERVFESLDDYKDENGYFGIVLVK